MLNNTCPRECGSCATPCSVERVSRKLGFTTLAPSAKNIEINTRAGMLVFEGNETLQQAFLAALPANGGNLRRAVAAVDPIRRGPRELTEMLLRALEGRPPLRHKPPVAKDAGPIATAETEFWASDKIEAFRGGPRGRVVITAAPEMSRAFYEYGKKRGVTAFAMGCGADPSALGLKAGTTVFLALDNAPIGTQKQWAAKRLHQHLRKAGLQVQLIQTDELVLPDAPDFAERWSRKDRLALGAALRQWRRAPPRTERPPVAEVRPKMQAELEGWLDRLAGAGPLTAMQGEVRYANAGAGMGKSRVAYDWFPRAIAAGRLTPERPGYLCPDTQELVDEAAERIGLDPEIMAPWKGRSVVRRPATETDPAEHYCLRWEELKPLQKLGGNLGKVCLSPIDPKNGPFGAHTYCKFYDNCLYIKMMLRFALAPGRIIPSNMLFMPPVALPSCFRREPALVVPDERFWPAALGGRTPGKPVVTDIEFLLGLRGGRKKGAHSEADVAALDADFHKETVEPLVRLAEREIRLGRGEGLPTETVSTWMDAEGATPETLRGWTKAMMRYRREIPAWPVMSEWRWEAAKTAAPHNAALMTWRRKLLILADFIEFDMPRGAAACDKIFGALGGVAGTQLVWSRPVAAPFNTAPTLLLEAGASERIIRTIFPGAEPIGDWQASTPNAVRLQDPFAAMGKTALARPETQLNVSWAVHELAAMAKGREAKTALITHENIKEKVGAYSPPGTDRSLHFNKQAGIDRLGDVDALMVAGRTVGGVDEHQRDAAALRRPGEPPVTRIGAAWYPRSIVTKTLPDGTRVSWPHFGHPDPLTNEIIKQTCDAQCRQAGDRGRGILRGPDNPLIEAHAHTCDVGDIDGLLEVKNSISLQFLATKGTLSSSPIRNARARPPPSRTRARGRFSWPYGGTGTKKSPHG